MDFYFAPMEGVTDYIYRNAHNKYFKGVDKYFTPFIVTNQHGKYKSRDWEGILPENNKGIVVVPQILTNYSDQFIRTALDLNKLGYQEINLNLGCPSGTVVTKYKGSGFLAKPDELNRFLEEIFYSLHETGPQMKLSVKTRIGKDAPEEFARLIEIYNQYPMEELIVHPRIQKDYYKNTPNLPVFQEAIENSNQSLCYNGDIINNEGYHTISETFPTITKIMLGRGLVANPSLVTQIRNRLFDKSESYHGILKSNQEIPNLNNRNSEKAIKVRNKSDLNYDNNNSQEITKSLLLAFHNQIYLDYQGVLYGDKNVLYRMKELWIHMIGLFTNYEKYWKKIKKSQHLDEYEKVINILFEEENINNS